MSVKAYQTFTTQGYALGFNIYKIYAYPGQEYMYGLVYCPMATAMTSVSYSPVVALGGGWWLGTAADPNPTTPPLPPNNLNAPQICPYEAVIASGTDGAGSYTMQMWQGYWHATAYGPALSADEGPYTFIFSGTATTPFNSNPNAAPGWYPGYTTLTSATESTNIQCTPSQGNLLLPLGNFYLESGLEPAADAMQLADVVGPIPPPPLTATFVMDDLVGSHTPNWPGIAISVPLAGNTGTSGSASDVAFQLSNVSMSRSYYAAPVMSGNVGSHRVKFS
jgi:hypothetical protein